MTPLWSFAGFWIVLALGGAVCALYWGWSRWLWGTGLTLLLFGATIFWTTTWLNLLVIWILILAFLLAVNRPEFRRWIVMDRLYRHYRHRAAPPESSPRPQVEPTLGWFTGFVTDRLRFTRAVQPVSPPAPDDPERIWLESFPARLEACLRSLPTQDRIARSGGWSGTFSELDLWRLALPAEGNGAVISMAGRSRVLAQLAAREPAWALLAARTVFSGSYELLALLADQPSVPPILHRLATGRSVAALVDWTPAEQALRPGEGVVERARSGERDNVVGIRLEGEQWGTWMAEGIDLVLLAFRLSDPQHLLDDRGDRPRVAIALMDRENPSLDWHLMARRGGLEAYRLRVVSTFLPWDQVLVVQGEAFSRDPVESVRRFFRDRMELNRRAMALGVAQAFLDEASRWTTFLEAGSRSVAPPRPADLSAGVEMVWALDQRIHAELTHWQEPFGRPVELTVFDPDDEPDLLSRLSHRQAGILGAPGLAGPFGRLTEERVRLILWIEAGLFFGTGQRDERDPSGLLAMLHGVAVKERLALRKPVAREGEAQFDRLMTQHVGRLLHHATRASVRTLFPLVLPLRTGQRDKTGREAARRLARASSTFSFLLDAYYLTSDGLVGGREGKLADLASQVLSEAFFAGLSLETWRQRPPDDPLRRVQSIALERSLGRMEEAIDRFRTEFPPGHLRLWVHWVLLRRLRHRSGLRDDGTDLADLVRFPGAARNALLYLRPRTEDDPSGSGLGLFEKLAAIVAIVARLRTAVEQGLIAGATSREILSQAVARGLISAPESEEVEAAWTGFRTWLESGSIASGTSSLPMG
jgi:alkylation response protein AidB-like acyl-CoA dehydrogenase